MPVQKKSNTASPGEKQKKTWTQYVAIGLIVIVAVACVAIFSGLPNLISGDKSTQSTISGTIAEGDPVAIYFSTNIGNTTTFVYDPGTYTNEILNTYYPYRVVADSNSSIEDNDYSSFKVQIGNATIPYGLYAGEINAIAKAIVGKQYGERITVSYPFYAVVSCTAEDIKNMGYDIKDVKVGDIVSMSLGYTDVLGNQDAFIRNGVVTSIKDDLSGLSLNCGCDTFDVLPITKYSA